MSDSVWCVSCCVPPVCAAWVGVGVLRTCVRRAVFGLVLGHLCTKWPQTHGFGTAPCKTRRRAEGAGQQHTLGAASRRGGGGGSAAGAAGAGGEHTPIGDLWQPTTRQQQCRSAGIRILWCTGVCGLCCRCVRGGLWLSPGGRRRCGSSPRRADGVKDAHPDILQKLLSPQPRTIRTNHLRCKEGILCTIAP